MIRNILIGLLLAVAAFVGLLVLNAMNYGAEPVGGRVTLPAPPAISAERGAQNLSRAIQFKTITLASGDPRPGQEGEWLALHAWLEETYPAAHAAMTKELVPETLTLLYTWAGSDLSLKPLLLMAHQDVVPVNIGTEGDWEGAPFEGAIIDGYITQLLAGSEFDIPDAMIDETAHGLLHDQERQFQQYGITLEQMLQFRGQTQIF
jgi:carboxypeptidase PM20D1